MRCKERLAVPLLLLLLLLPQPAAPRQRQRHRHPATTGAGGSAWTPDQPTEPELAALREAAGAPADANATTLVALGEAALWRLRFASAAALFRLAATASAAAAPEPEQWGALVAAGVGLPKCGEVVLAKDILQHALATAPTARKARAAPTTKRALSAAAGSLAMVTAWHGSSLSKSERGAAIR